MPVTWEGSITPTTPDSTAATGCAGASGLASHPPLRYDAARRKPIARIRSLMQARKTTMQKIGLTLGLVLFFVTNLLDLDPGKPAVTRMAAVASSHGHVVDHRSHSALRDRASSAGPLPVPGDRTGRCEGIGIIRAGVRYRSDP